MSTDQPPPGPDDDPFAKKPREPGSPYGQEPPPPYQPPPYGGDPYGGGAGPPAGMPPLADSGKRLLARIVDFLIIAIPLFLLSLIWGGVTWWDSDTDNVDAGRSALESLVAAVAYVGYDTYLVAKDGRTVGKRLFGLRVANLSDGATPTMNQALLRAVVFWLPALFCCACLWTIVIGLTVLFDKPYRQGLHDKAGKTVVVSSPVTP